MNDRRDGNITTDKDYIISGISSSRYLKEFQGLEKDFINLYNSYGALKNALLEMNETFEHAPEIVHKHELPLIMNYLSDVVFFLKGQDDKVQSLTKFIAGSY